MVGSRIGETPALYKGFVAVNKLHRFISASLSPYGPPKNGDAHVSAGCISLCWPCHGITLSAPVSDEELYGLISPTTPCDPIPAAHVSR